MISIHDNCLFIHIPKTAGQSVESVFLERAGLSWEQREALLLRKNHDPKLGPPRLAHLTAREYLELGYVSQQQFDSMYKFAVVRNPFERLVSEFTYQKYPYSFRDFLFKHFPKPGEDDYQKCHGHYRHVMPQWEFVCDRDGQLLVDDIIFFERIAEGFERVSSTLFGAATPLPHKNPTASRRQRIQKRIAETLLGKQKKSNDTSRHYHDFYDDATRLHVETLYKRDIELFEYTF